MKVYRWEDVKRERRRMHPVDEEALQLARQLQQAEIRAYKLAEIRQATGMNQNDVARRIGVSQSRISRMESGDIERAGLATIRDYIEALGGELEVVATFDNERIVIA
ncbi:MAG TPA: helix-turn-helix transcriptional regulator [Thermomicrobiales bacterium]|nr:helix-turn-helix transcriptional regulator [Thermomicrobiales bacterium]